MEARMARRDKEAGCKIAIKKNCSHQRSLRPSFRNGLVSTAMLMGLERKVTDPNFIVLVRLYTLDHHAHSRQSIEYPRVLKSVSLTLLPQKSRAMSSLKKGITISQSTIQSESREQVTPRWILSHLPKTLCIPIATAHFCTQVGKGSS